MDFDDTWDIFGKLMKGLSSKKIKVSLVNAKKAIMQPLTFYKKKFACDRKR